MPRTLKLLDKIQFIYELNLAQLELRSFCPEVKTSDGFREFTTATANNVDALKKRLAYFKTVDDAQTDYYHLQQFNQTKSANQFLTHWIYPYKGKFHPQMIRALLNITKVRAGETILDPFVGSGTSVLEAQILGINGIGVDVSPLCVLISKVKTESVDVVDDIKASQPFFLHSQSQKGAVDDRVSNFYKVAEMMAHSDYARRKKDFASSYINDAAKMLKSVEDYQQASTRLNLRPGKTKIMQGDARSIKLNDESVDGIITSPPYSIALNYVANDAHSLEALGYNTNKIKEEFIGVRGTTANKFKLYDADMEKSYREMYRVLKKGKYCVVVIGNVTFQGREIDTTRRAVSFCEQIGFRTVDKIEKIIYGLYNVMQKEYILIFQK